MINLCIFVSSPGDVGEERVIAGRVIDRLQAEFAAAVSLEPVIWEHEPLRATASFQEELPRPSKADVCVFILWSRLGTRLPRQITRVDGSLYASGTEFEFEDAFASYRERKIPDLLVYRKTARPFLEYDLKQDSKYNVLERIAQIEALTEFLNKWFVDTDGSLIGAFHEFEIPAQFEDRLEKHLRKLIERRLKQNQPATWSATPVPRWYKGSPFRGLEAFEIAHGPIFFGRTQAVSEVMDALRRQATKGRAFIMILGMSGVGKSSLVRAGVLPNLTQPGVIEGIGLWRYAIIRPADASGDLFDTLAVAILRKEALPELSAGTTAGELAKLLRETPQAVVPLLKIAFSQAAVELQRNEGLTRQPSARLALVVDQMEEIFTIARVTSRERAAFIRALDVLAHSGLVWIISTLRSDFYQHCAELPELLDLKEGAGQYDLRPPTPAEIGQIIREPTRMAGLSFAVDSKTKRVLDDVLRDAVVQDPSALPLLEFTLQALYERCSVDIQGFTFFTFDAYQALGGLEGALAKRAEEVFCALNADAKATLPSVLSALVNLGPGEKDIPIRKRASFVSLTAAPDRRMLVDAFIGARLFVADRTDDGTPVVSVVHEALLSHWPRLQEWLDDDNKKFLRARSRISMSRAVWHEQGEPRELLLPQGKLLTEAKGLFDSRLPELEPEDAEFIQTSINATLRRRRHQVIGLSLVGLLMIAAYVALSDVGLKLPGGNLVRLYLDRHDTSVFRPVSSLVELKNIAKKMRQELSVEISSRRTSEAWIHWKKLAPNEFKPGAIRRAMMTDAWTQSQALASIFSMPDLNQHELGKWLDSLELLFGKNMIKESEGVKYGWVAHPEAEDSVTIVDPALWTASALALALGRSGVIVGDAREQFEDHLFNTQEVLRSYRPTDFVGGWNKFPLQKDAKGNAYISQLALRALMDTKLAGLGWEKSEKQRDKLIDMTATWLVKRFDPQLPGWQRDSNPDQVSSNLTLLICGAILRAEAEVGLRIPEEITNHIAQTLEKYFTGLGGSDEKESFIADPFLNYNGHNDFQPAAEIMTFLWYPWAIDCSVRWLNRQQKLHASPEDLILTRRGLSQLLIALGDENIAKAHTESTYIAAELLYGLSAFNPVLH
jgi:hypothetical protein